MPCLFFDGVDDGYLNAVRAGTWRTELALLGHELAELFECGTDEIEFHLNSKHHTSVFDGGGTCLVPQEYIFVFGEPIREYFVDEETIDGISGAIPPQLHNTRLRVMMNGHSGDVVVFR